MKVFVPLVALLLPLCSPAQVVKKYCDRYHHLSSRNRADCYRTYTPRPDGLCKVEERTITGDTLLLSGFYSSPDSESKTGHFISYYPNGNKNGEGDYVADKKEGEWKMYFADAELLWFTKQYTHGALNGPSIKYLRNGHPRWREEFINDSSISFIGYDMAGNETKYKPIEVEPSPTFNISDFLAKNLNYPKVARKKGITGRVLIVFTVNVDGHISDVRTTTHVGGGCEEEAIRIVNLFPPWRPGIQDDVPTPVEYTLPLNFRLD